MHLLIIDGLGAFLRYVVSFPDLITNEVENKTTEIAYLRRDRTRVSFRIDWDPLPCAWSAWGYLVYSIPLALREKKTKGRSAG